MVRRIDPSCEGFYVGGIDALRRHESVAAGRIIRAGGDIQVHRCGVNARADALAFWGGSSPGECVCYLVISPRHLPNLPAWDVVRAWVAQAVRGSGIYPQLLACAAAYICQPVASDPDGMTPAAYRSWIRARDLRRSMFNGLDNSHSEIDDVPEAERFVEGIAGSKWRLVAWPTGWDGFLLSVLPPTQTGQG